MDQVWLASRANATEPFEVMRALRKSQARAFNLTRDPIGEKRMIERAFGVGPCVMSEAVAFIEQQLAG
ncbi:MAG: hypothetical protein AAFV87_18835 [Pseudomonadota bacterium]